MPDVRGSVYQRPTQGEYNMYLDALEDHNAHMSDLLTAMRYGSMSSQDKHDAWYTLTSYIYGLIETYETWDMNGKLFWINTRVRHTVADIVIAIVAALPERERERVQETMAQRPCAYLAHDVVAPPECESMQCCDLAQ